MFAISSPFLCWWSFWLPSHCPLNVDVYLSLAQFLVLLRLRFVLIKQERLGRNVVPIRGAQCRCHTCCHLVLVVLPLWPPRQKPAPFVNQFCWNPIAKQSPVELPEVPADLHEIIVSLAPD